MMTRCPKLQTKVILRQSWRDCDSEDYRDFEQYVGKSAVVVGLAGLREGEDIIKGNYVHVLEDGQTTGYITWEIYGLELDEGEDDWGE